MPDSSPHDQRASVHDRTAKIEELLLAGLDYYFAGDHDRAITVWTRVLFLDRGHARARAYIERARGALAERQRESEALIQQGMAAFDQGEASAARELLSSAIARGGPHDVAVALLDRLNRLDTPAMISADPPQAPGMAARARIRPQRTGSQSRAWWLVAFAPVLLLAAAAVYVVTAFPEAPSWRGADDGSSGAAAPRPVRDVLPLPRSGDIALAQARRLSASGHLKDALAVLDTITPGDPAHPDAEQLRAEIQASLLAGLPPLAGAR